MTGTMAGTRGANTMSNVAAHKKPPAMTGDELRALIAEYGMDQNQFAELVGVHYVTVSRWVTGAAVINESHVLLIRERLKARKKPKK